jgi:Fic family protein
LDITEWLLWFLGCLDRAIIASEEGLANVINKAKFWDKLNTKKLNDRQKLMVNKLLDGIDGKLSSSKWAKICKCSQDTALRDIQDLMTQGVLEKEGSGGRSTNYKLADLHSI